MRKLLSVLFFWIGHYIPNVFPRTKEGKAIALIEDAGYRFLPLWSSMPPLSSNSMDVSFVIPVYNSEKYIRKCLDSILNQKTRYKYEVICINDGSTDDSLEILNEYKSLFSDKLIVINQNNHGISITRNKGIEIAKGEYVGFIDNDDFVASDYVQLLIDKAKQTKADLIQTGIIEVDCSGKIISKTNRKDAEINAEASIEDKSLVSGYIWCGVVRKSLFQKVRFPEGFWYEDMITRMIILRISRKTEIIGKHLYYKLIHSTNASQILWKPGNIKAIDEYWLTRSLIDYSIKELGCRIDEATYHELLYEFGTTLCVRTRLLGLKIHKAVFFLASDYMKDLNYNYTYNDKIKNNINRSLLSGNYLQWICFCLSYKFNPTWIL